eukprot:TRINITY_DN12805_c0_g2_i1.p2 TRINITY_DN12805_c0_g2~~TRINITY_DN12805_c0_g2_i1.p2  ORF type:complete len:285 (+),score=61.28 TRINITY_DN12805_c0_g2_i1:490-1344(+)
MGIFRRSKSEGALLQQDAAEAKPEKKGKGWAARVFRRSATSKDAMQLPDEAPPKPLWALDVQALRSPDDAKGSGGPSPPTQKPAALLYYDDDARVPSLDQEADDDDFVLRPTLSGQLFSQHLQNYGRQPSPAHGRRTAPHYMLENTPSTAASSPACGARAASPTVHFGDVNTWPFGEDSPTTSPTNSISNRLREMERDVRAIPNVQMSGKPFIFSTMRPRPEGIATDAHFYDTPPIIEPFSLKGGRPRRKGPIHDSLGYVERTREFPTNSLQAASAFKKSLGLK